MADKLEAPASKAEMVQEALAELGLGASLAEVRKYLADKYKETISEPSVWATRKKLKEAYEAKVKAAKIRTRTKKPTAIVKSVVAPVPAVAPTASYHQMPVIIETARYLIEICGGDRAAAAKILEVV